MKSKEGDGPSKELLPSDDIFSHMNQDNLNYIKNELRLKKSKQMH